MIALIATVGYLVFRLFFPNLPKSVQVFDVVHLNDSTWYDEATHTGIKQDYYHTDQGSRLMNYEWYINLERFGRNGEMFNDPKNYSRYRLIPDPNPENNPYRLPVGFAITDPDPIDNIQYVGISCATCHTGQLNYKGVGLRIDGGSGMVNFNAFLQDMIASLGENLVNPFSFNRFAKRVYGEDVSSAQKKQLKRDIRKYIGQQFISQVNEQSETFKQMGVNTYQGFGRIDALGAGGNALYANFGKKNLRPLDAPVGIPVLWYTHQYDWVQLNSSIRQPMSRNIIEALAVNARVTVPGYADWNGKKNEMYLTNIEMQKMYALEEAVKKLKAPKWPEDILGPIQEELVKKGELLYTELCANCHAKKYEKNYGYWPKQDGDTVSRDFRKLYYQLRITSLDTIGTDPTDARNFESRTLDATSLIQALEKFGMETGGVSMAEAKKVSGAKIIPLVINGAMKRSYDSLKLQWKREGLPVDSASLYERISEWNGFRQSMWDAPLGYAARPLAGIWTSAPYLHNNSVPNLYQLLSPVKERSTVFYTGDLEFDPKNVGYLHEKFKGGSKIDTRKKGNSNAGHEFSGDGEVYEPGVIGRYLKPEERYAIIEYLKQLEFKDEGYEQYFPYSTYGRNYQKNYGDTSTRHKLTIEQLKQLFTSNGQKVVSKEEKAAIEQYLAGATGSN